MKIALDSAWMIPFATTLRLVIMSKSISKKSGNFLSYDKPWDEDFQDIPGTPGREINSSLDCDYSW